MPRKAKRGGGARGGGRSEEEKLLQLQQRLQVEEEMEKKKEEILTLFLKDKLQKEERNTAVNLLKLSDGWRSILRHARSAELRRDVAVLRQTFERQLDGLDAAVGSLAGDLQEAEHQWARVRRLHLQHVERLTALQHQRVTDLQRRWESCLHSISCSFTSERADVATLSEQRRGGLEDALFALEQQHKDSMSEIHRMYSDSVAALHSAHQDRTAALVHGDAEELSEKTRRNQEAQQQHQSEAEEVELLMSRNQQLIEMTNADVKRVQLLQDAVVNLRAELNSVQTETASVAGDLTAANHQLKGKSCELREQLTQSGAAARKQLTELTVHSAAAARRLNTLVAKGEAVLRVAEMCRKMESQQESFFTTVAEERGRQPPQTQEPEGVPKTLEFPEFPELQELLRRHNAALLRREALKKHQEDVKRENQQLRLLLRQHLDAMTVSDAALDGRHALLSVSRAPVATGPASTGPASTDRRHTVMEAAHVVKHSL